MEKMITFPLQSKRKALSDKIMLYVLVALIPGIATNFYLYGVGILIQLIIAIVTALLSELIYSKIRKRELTMLGLTSTMVTAFLLTLSVPSISPWWVIITAVLSALFIGKYIFGGIGMNIFNPAALGFCFVYLCFSYSVSNWPKEHISKKDTIGFIFSNENVDNLTSPTILTEAKVNQIDAKSNNEIKNIREIKFSDINLLVTTSWVFGGIFLLIIGALDYRLIISTLLGLIFTTIFYRLLFDYNLMSFYHLISGATIFSLFFIVTDPTTAASSKKGRYIYGILIGFLVITIRFFGNMPDAWAFAILLANSAVPFIDEYTKPNYGDKIKNL